MTEKMPYNFNKAYDEGEKIKHEIKWSKNKDYSEAERKVEEDKKIKEIGHTLKEKYKAEICFDEDDHYSRLELLSKTFNGLENVRGKRILDLGCGSNGGTVETDDFDKSFLEDGLENNTRMFEPWLCRALVELGANPVGIDVGSLEGEEFEHYQINLLEKSALNFLPDKSFDGINVRLLFSSPQLEKEISIKRRCYNEYSEEKEVKRKMKQEIEKQIKRLLKDDGKIIQFDAYL